MMTEKIEPVYLTEEERFTILDALSGLTHNNRMGELYQKLGKAWIKNGEKNG